VSGWGDMVADQARTCGRPEYLPTHMFEAYKTRRLNGRYPISFTGEQRAAYLAGIGDVLKLQADWYDLPPADAVWELRRGTASIFHPIFADGTGNPTTDVECPSGRVHNPGSRVAVDRDGTCPTCGYDFTSSARIQGDST
jgi:hypothetical protein